MPVQVSYPGVYIEEMPSTAHPIVGVSTSDTAFVDVFLRGPIDHPVRVTSMADLERTFGGLWAASEASYGISQYFLNGGQVAWVVRMAPESAATASGELRPIEVVAASPGAWGNSVQVAAINAAEDLQDDDGNKMFSLAVREVGTRRGKQVILATELFHNLTMEPGPRNVADVLEHESALVRVSATNSDFSGKGAIHGDDDSTVKPARMVQALNSLAGSDGVTLNWVGLTGGNDGFDASDPSEVTSALEAMLPGDEAAHSGIYALAHMAPERFDILCIPAAAFVDDDTRRATQTAAAEFCAAQRAFYIVDIPIDRNSSTHRTPEQMEELFETDELGKLPPYAAVYYPPVAIADPLHGHRPRVVPPSGTMAGLFARTDTARGVWKAPAGTEATLQGATPVVTIDDAANGPLNSIGVNVLRNFPIYGSISWGARTVNGADMLGSQWKYVPVRRLALFMENSLYEGTKWAVFEPNDEPLWAQLRLNIGVFMHDLFRQGAFEGSTPAQAYFVRCDSSTTTQSDIDKGIVNVAVGFAPLKPAEFVVIQISQITNLTGG